MSRYLPVDLAPEGPKPQRSRSARLRDAHGWLFLGMGLAGILTVALIVTADQSYAGIDGLRARRAIVPENEQDHPAAVAGVPLVGGLAAVIHDLAPVFFAPTAPPADPVPVADAAPATGSARPANSPSPRAEPSDVSVPTAQQPSGPTPSPAPTRAVLPSPSPSPANSSAPFIPPAPTPAPSATPSPSATPAPILAISTDRGATAVVNVADLVPGDSMVRTITVQNSGSLAFRYTVSATATASTILWTDTSDGLQLLIETTGGSPLYAGPLSGLAAMPGPTTLAPGTTETLRYTVGFPASAPNSFQGLLQDLTLVFDAVEFP